MAVFQDQIQATITIDNNQAINELGKLEMAHADVRGELKQLAGDVRKYENEVKKLDKYKIGKDNFEAAQKEVNKLNNFVGRYETLLKSANNQLKNTDAGTEEFGKAKAKVDALSSSIENYKTRLKAANKEVTKNKFAAQKYEETNEVVKKLESSVEQFNRTAQKTENAAKAVNEYRSSLKATEMTMQQMKKELSLVQKQLDNQVAGSVKHKELSNRFRELNSEISNQNTALRSTETGWKKFTGSFKSFGIMAAGVIGGEIVMQAFQWITSFVIGIATGAAKISDELSDIQKSTGMTAEEVKSLNSELGKIDTRSSNASLREIAKVAGQLGIKKDEIKGFTEQVDKMNVALGDEFTGGAEEITRKVGTLQTLFKDTKDMKADEAMNRIGSSLNALGAAGKARAPEVADFANRLGALGKLAPSITESSRTCSSSYRRIRTYFGTSSRRSNQHHARSWKKCRGFFCSNWYYGEGIQKSFEYRSKRNVPSFSSIYAGFGQ